MFFSARGTTGICYVIKNLVLKDIQNMYNKIHSGDKGTESNC